MAMMFHKDSKDRPRLTIVTESEPKLKPRASNGFDELADLMVDLLDDLKSDLISEKGHTGDMSDITREEFNARLETQQLKVDARLKEFEGKVTEGITQMNHSLQLLEKDLTGVRGLKGTIILNSVLSVIAIVGIVIGVMAYGVANFDSGRETSVLVQEAKQQTTDTRELLEQIRKEREAHQQKP
ncbi:hypothetical protein [Pseudomonas denitrificans (nom. rej.)]|uniref:Uncharacterized protein n=1 Tax=Pseudomonas denitrificans TaxID=43306 RepID=A0A9X7R2P5_PSEDE|nr:hypothetical protein [Pseudomonas denitrificans (nom. rej.)]QEY70478.1 hypothetical protein F1C79_01720 [Pseudomonas denitrificans (nom. rej.)]